MFQYKRLSGFGTAQDLGKGRGQATDAAFEQIDDDGRQPHFDHVGAHHDVERPISLAGRGDQFVHVRPDGSAGAAGTPEDPLPTLRTAINAAVAGGYGGVKVAAGEYADLAVLSADYFAIPVEEIKDLSSVLTMVGGEGVHGSGGFGNLALPLPPVRPEASAVTKGRLISVSNTVESSILAFSAASLSR